MRNNTWTNADGLVVGFGTRDTVNTEAGSIHSVGNTKELHMDLHALHAVTTRQPKSVVIPAGSVITSARVLVDTAFTGGTNLQIGTADLDGGNADTDMLVATTVTANLTANATIEGAGVAVDGAMSTADRFITFTTAGTFTAGQARLVVEFI